MPELTGEVHGTRRVVIADDHVLVREGIASLLKEVGFVIVGQAGSPSELIQLVASQLPDLAIIDIRMPPNYSSEGIEVAREIRRDFPGVGILLLSSHVELETAIDLLQGGASIGYLLKDRIVNIADLTDALNRISSGGSVIDPDLVQELLSSRRHSDPLEKLTKRELDVLELVAEGRSNSGIASRLFVSEGAVMKHMRNILMKLNIVESDEDHRRVLAVLKYLDSR
jgi:serine/threonine-protein kinase PknK